MRKEKNVTRTFDTTQFIVIGIKDNQIVQFASDEIVGKLDEKQCKEYAEKVYTDVMVAGVTDVTYDSALYGMPESVFLANAVKLPPRGTKEIEEAEE